MKNVIWLCSSFLCMMIMVFIFTSCGSRSLDDFQEEGEGIMRSLIQELHDVRTRDQLLASTGKLKRLFDCLVDTMIAAEEYRYSHFELDKRDFMHPNHELSDKLRLELNRLYRIEGGRQIIEKCQEKSLYRLDAFAKRHVK